MINCALPFILRLSVLTLFLADDYYNPAFHFCEPEGGAQKQPESLGSILFGDRIFNSAYNVRSEFLIYIPFHLRRRLQISMLENNGSCQTTCTTTVPIEDAKFVNDRIKEDYALNWLIDGLPAAEAKKDLKSGDIFFDIGFNLGNDEEELAERPALNNHYDIIIK